MSGSGRAQDVPHPRHAVALLVVAALAIASAPAPDAEARRDHFRRMINAGRERAGLEPVRRDALLDLAAQAHADDMAAKNYYAFSSPEGRDIDAWVEEAGYPARLVAERLMSEATPPEALTLGWRLDPGNSRDSFLHPEASDLGVGLATTSSGRWLYVFVLAQPLPGSRPGRQTPAPLAPLAELRSLFLAELNRERQAAGLPALVAEPALETAAQAHAAELLRARQRTTSTSGLRRLVAPLAERVSDERRGQSAGKVRGGSVIYQRVPGTAQGQAVAVGEAVVIDASGAGEALASALDSPMASQLRDPHHLRFGLGVAHRPADPASGTTSQSVWVACTAPPPR